MTRRVPVIALAATVAIWSAPAPASASVTGIVCSLGGLVSGFVGKACDVVTNPGRIISAGKEALGGHVGGALSALSGTTAGRVVGAVGLAAIGAAVVAAAHYALRETVVVIGATTSPNLSSTWFSAFYWRMASVAALLTLPFLFAAAIQALIRSDLSMLARAAFGYLPLAMLAVGIAAPLTNLLLAGSDEMSAIVASASGHTGTDFLLRTFASNVLSATFFVSLFVGGVTVAAAVALWTELVIREAAVYLIVLMLPLFFAAMVWPARRVWAKRAVELLVALILSKFAIVAVLALGGAALAHSASVGVAAGVAGGALVLLAAFTPWALLRLLPLHELASAAAGGLSGPTKRGTEKSGENAHRSTNAAEDRHADLAERIRDASQPAARQGGTQLDRIELPQSNGTGTDCPAPATSTGDATPNAGMEDLSIAPGPEPERGTNGQSGPGPQRGATRESAAAPSPEITTARGPSAAVGTPTHEDAVPGPLGTTTPALVREDPPTIDDPPAAPTPRPLPQSEPSPGPSGRLAGFAEAMDANQGLRLELNHDGPGAGWWHDGERQIEVDPVDAGDVEGPWPDDEWTERA
ncbi:MAG: hypothetical protein ACRDMJ_12845 [Solirubrobacteraceae bacterium]